MEWKWIVLLILSLGFVYRLVLNIVLYRSAGNPTPENVSDVYDAETYQKWKRYCAEQSRFEIVSEVVTFAIFFAMLIFDVYAAFASLFGAGLFAQMAAVLILDILVGIPMRAIQSYVVNMIIEEKYGFNKTNKKTFVADLIRGMIVELLLSFALAGVLCLLYRAMGDWVILLFAGVMFLFTMVISFLYPIFSRIGNKFTPLEEGELRDRLMELLTKHGYRVKAIEVMDASRRTTKMNAYFTGFGKMKTIVLYDNLVSGMSTDEICAVFAHELGHGLHRDVTKQQIMNLGNLVIMGLIAFASVSVPEMHAAFGFESVNYGFAYLLIGIGLGLTQPLTGILTNAYSRHAEYRADRQAVQEGYGPAMITGLKRLAKENFAHLAPARALVILQYSHPPMSERIAAIEAEMGKK